MTDAASVDKPGKRPVHGVLLLDKPLLLSSNSALQKARWHFHAQKAGHTGVLDPMATGLLPVCFGEATKFSAFLLDADKGYTATLRLGQTTTTFDIEGEIVNERPVEVSRAQLEAVLAQFIGPIQQLPPMYSALKFQGKALYEYARQGIEIERKTRDVVIHHITLLAFTDDTVVLDVQCSKGTYIRSLAHDIGQALGCGAHLTALRRTRTAGFALDHALTLEQLAEIPFPERQAVLLPVDVLVQHFPALTATDDEKHRLTHGQPVHSPQNSAIMQDFRLYDTSGMFFGLGQIRADGQLWPNRLLVNTSTVGA